MNKYTLAKVVISVTILATAYAPPDRLLNTYFGNAFNDKNHPSERAERTLVQEIKSKASSGHTIVRRNSFTGSETITEPKPGYFLNGDSKVEFNATIKLQLERKFLQQQIKKTELAENALFQARRKVKELEVEINKTQGLATIEILKDIIRQTAINATLLLQKERAISNATIAQLQKENEDLKIRSKEIAVSIVSELDKNSTFILQSEKKIVNKKLEILQKQYDELKEICDQKDEKITKIESCCGKRTCELPPQSIPIE